MFGEHKPFWLETDKSRLSIWTSDEDEKILEEVKEEDYNSPIFNVKNLFQYQYGAELIDKSNLGIIELGDFYCFHCRNFGHKPISGNHCTFKRVPMSSEFEASLKTWCEDNNRKYMCYNRNTSPKTVNEKKVKKKKKSNSPKV